MVSMAWKCLGDLGDLRLGDSAERRFADHLLGPTGARLFRGAASLGSGPPHLRGLQASSNR